jgi:hypothetical protein
MPPLIEDGEFIDKLARLKAAIVRSGDLSDRPNQSPAERTVCRWLRGEGDPVDLLCELAGTTPIATAAAPATSVAEVNACSIPNWQNPQRLRRNQRLAIEALALGVFVAARRRARILRDLGGGGF